MLLEIRDFPKRRLDQTGPDLGLPNILHKLALSIGHSATGQVLRGCQFGVVAGSNACVAAGRILATDSCDIESKSMAVDLIIVLVLHVLRRGYWASLNT